MYVHSVESVGFLWLAHLGHWASSTLNLIFAGYRDSVVKPIILGRMMSLGKSHALMK
jgi:hypothetical protein